MHLHEHQAKTLFAEAGIPVPAGRVAYSLREALGIAADLGGGRWVVKAQVHAGGRGKAGGVRVVEGEAALGAAVGELLGSRLVTAQTGPQGQPVDRLLLERPVAVARELYLACLVDRAAERVAFVAAGQGGVEIEALARAAPERMHRVEVDPVVGLQPYQCRQLGFALGLDGGQRRALQSLMLGLYDLFTRCDLSLAEINPLAVTAEGELLALDAKVDVDDNALYRQQALEALQDPSQEDPRDHKARQFGLNYISLDGDIACMVNGAGLAMATMDLIKLHGGEPANFLDVGGGTTAEKVAEAFKIILSEPRVRAILVNIFGGIVRCDLIAEGIVKAVREVALDLPLVVRLAGTRAEAGRALLRDSGLPLIAAGDLTEAARRAVAAARGEGP